MNNDIELRIMRLPHAADLPPPAYPSAHAASLDLVAAIPPDVPLITTGLVVTLPPGTEGQIRPRSGLALRHGVTVLAAPQTVDADYRGEVHVILVNLGREPFPVARGMRIAQLVVSATVQATLCEVSSDEDE